MKNKIIVILILVGFAAAMFWIIPILRGRYFSETKKEEQQIPEVEQNEKVEKNDKQSENLENEDEDIADEEVDVEDEEIEEDEEDQEAEDEDSEETVTNEFLKITQKDCDNGCQDFSNEKENLKYCQERCGLSPKQASSDCANLADLEKDYCLKDLAVSKKDFAICDRIVDFGIRKSCKDRIAEDIL